MPAKKIITKQILIDGAIEIIRRDGGSALNMRNLAKQCNCSTQPIYLSFKGIDELKCEVRKRVAELFDKFIANELASGKYPPYKAIGMGYVRFAKQESELFKYVFMCDRKNEYRWETGSFNKSTDILMKEFGLNREDATTFHTEMWIFVHGIATMIATGYQNWSGETVSQMLTDVWSAVISKFKRREIN